ncbi:MAG: hypothetical protein ACR2KG_06330 [Nocardioidaceae bacterium]
MRLVAGLSFAHSQPLLHWAYADWTAASAETRESLPFAGPWAAGVAAWVAARFASRRSIICPLLAPRRGLPLVRAHLSILAGWGLVGYFGGLAPVLTTTALGATWGHPDWLVLLASSAALVGFMGLGYLTGCLLPLAAAVPTAAAISFFAVINTGDMGTVTGPFYPFGVEAGLREPGVVMVFRVLFFVAAVVLTGAASAWWMRESTASYTTPALLGVVLVVLPLPLIGFLANRQSPPLVEHDYSQATCERVDGVDVCVHPARAVMLGPLTRAVEKVSRAIGPARPYTRVLDATLWPQPRPDEIVLQLQAQDRNGWTTSAVQDMVDQIANVSVCAAQAQTNPSRSPLAEQAAVSGAVGIWLDHEVGVAGDNIGGWPESVTLAARLEAKPANEVRAALVKALPSIRACQGTIAQLP